MKVLIPGALRSYTRGSPVEAQGSTLAAMFADLERQFPGLRFRVVDEQGLLRANMRIFVNGVGVRDLGFALAPGDSVALVLALSGG
jgi:sulfur-carrier protein